MIKIPEEPAIGDLPSSPSEAFRLGWRMAWCEFGADDWRPMDSAPRDKVILITDGNLVEAAIWNGDEAPEFPWMTFDPEVSEKLNGWRPSNGYRWRPLLAPPVEGE